MSVYRDRVGQRIGPLEVVADHKRTQPRRSGGRRVVWRCIDHSDGSEHFYRTEQIIRLDRLHHAANQSGGADR